MASKVISSLHTIWGSINSRYSIVYKPPGFHLHSSLSNPSVEDLLKNQYQDNQQFFFPLPLEKEAEGLLLVAHDEYMNKQLKSFNSQGKIIRRYMVLTEYPSLLAIFRSHYALGNDSLSPLEIPDIYDSSMKMMRTQYLSSQPTKLRSYFPPNDRPLDEDEVSINAREVTPKWDKCREESIIEYLVQRLSLSSKRRFVRGEGGVPLPINNLISRSNRGKLPCDFSNADSFHSLLDTNRQTLEVILQLLHGVPSCNNSVVTQKEPSALERQVIQSLKKNLGDTSSPASTNKEGEGFLLWEVLAPSLVHIKDIFRELNIPLLTCQEGRAEMEKELLNVYSPRFTASQLDDCTERVGLTSAVCCSELTLPDPYCSSSSEKIHCRLNIPSSWLHLSESMEDVYDQISLQEWKMKTTNGDSRANQKYSCSLYMENKDVSGLVE